MQNVSIHLGQCGSVVEHHSMHQEVAGLIPCQGIWPSVELDPRYGACRRLVEGNLLMILSHH